MTPLETVEDVDVKQFMGHHGIEPWPTSNDQIETALRLGGLTVLFVEKLLDGDRWRLSFLRQEPHYFNADVGTAARLCGLLQSHGITIDPADMALKKASFRLEAAFTWSAGQPGRGISFGFVQRSRLVEHREEYFSRVGAGRRSRPYK
jgi:hypothetical protein